MKKIITIITIVLCISANAQCEKVKKGYNELTGETLISSPYQSDYNAVSGGYNMRGTLLIQKSIKSDLEKTFIVFGGSGSTSMINSKGLFIKLSNGEILRFEDFEINSNYVSNGQFSYSCYLTLSEDYKKLFSENNIESYGIGINKYEPKKKDSEKFKKYVGCVINQK